MIRKLMQSIREFKLFSLLSPLFVVLEVVMEVVIPLLMAKLIDEGIDGAGGMDAVMHYGWILLVFSDLRRTRRTLCGVCLCRICTESAARYVLPCPEVFLFQHR